jgi:hypothetical protein
MPEALTAWARPRALNGFGAEDGFWRTLGGKLVTEADYQQAKAMFVDPIMGFGRLVGDVYAGRADPSSDEAIGRVADMAGTMTLGAGAIPAKGAELGMGIRAFHGSPHDFDRFDMSKIGTGEGAQAYGHGLYFAENEGVARQYRDVLGGYALDGKALGKVLSDELAAAGGNVDAVIAQYKKMAAGAEERNRPFFENRLRMLEEYRDSIKPAGRMYEVEIAAEPEQFLDWDKPLSQQSEAVRTAIPAEEDIPAQLAYYRLAGELTGEKSLQSPEASKALRERGIPGIKYKDQGSRGKDVGTHNYVVFDDKLVSILRKYGLPITAAGVATAAQMGVLPDKAQAKTKGR